MGFSEILIDAGIDRYVLLMVLFLPILGTVVSISRHIIGARQLGLYVPIVLTYALAELSIDAQGDINFVNGVKYGGFLIVFIFSVSLLIYSLLRKVRIHYFPKVGFVFSAISILILMLFYVSTLINKMGITHQSILAIVLIAVVTEKLISTYAKHGLKKTLFITLDTLVLTFISFGLLSLNFTQEFLLQNPWIVGATLIINLFIGRYSGLRLQEYIRFYSILNKSYSSKTDKPTQKIN